jgi:hypothetical protein
MNVHLKSVRDAGNHAKERVVLKVAGNTDIGRYAIFDTTFDSEENVSNKLRHAYWFPDATVSEGDLVVLYTKDGDPKKVKNKDGSTTHFFYWGLERTVWNEDGDGAVLFLIKEWEGLRAFPTAARQE